jgi:hypothetical protein
MHWSKLVHNTYTTESVNETKIELMIESIVPFRFGWFRSLVLCAWTDVILWELHQLITDKNPFLVRRESKTARTNNRKTKVEAR